MGRAVSNNFRLGAASQVRMMSGAKQESDAEFDAKYIAYFDRKDIDGWEIRKGMADMGAMDLVPEPTILAAALRACRRVNDYSLTTRILEITKVKCGDKEAEFWPYIMQELKPTLDELGIATLEEMGYDIGCLVLPPPSRTTEQFHSCEATTIHLGYSHMTALCEGSKPKLFKFTRMSQVQQLRFQPIIDTWPIHFSNPSSIMKSTQCVSVVPNYHLCCAEVKASASRCVFLKKPSIRTMICVLGKSKAQERAKSQQEQLHYGLFWDVKLQCPHVLCVDTIF